MSWSLILSNYNSILSFSVTCHPVCLLCPCPFVLFLCPCPFICLIPTLSSILYHMYMFFFQYIYVLQFGMCSNGLGVRVEDSLPRGLWLESPLEQFVLKTRAVNSILGNRNMIGKILTWWENSYRGNRKLPVKNSAMVGNFPQWEKKSFPLHGSLSTAAPVLYAGIYLPLFSQCMNLQRQFTDRNFLFFS